MAPFHRHSRSSRSSRRKAERIVACSGKVYYDLISKRSELRLTDEVAIVRVEQLYPFPHQLVEEMKRYPRHNVVVWCQEEPQNQGAVSERPLFARTCADQKPFLCSPPGFRRARGRLHGAP